MTLSELYRAIKQRFQTAGLPTPDLDARLLISYALGCAPDDVLLKPDMPVESNRVLDDAVARRLKSEPVSKITGQREFYGLVFDVTADVLDPRADTETLVDEARKYLKPGTRILDLCTGTSAILTALLTLEPTATGVAADISDAALNVARGNIKRHGLESRVQILKSNWLENITGAFDIITCNPPYIESAAIGELHDDVRLYDPHLALDGGADGMEPYRIVFPQIRNHMNDGAVALFEIGATQGPDITRLAQNTGFTDVRVIRDYGDNARVVFFR